MKTVKKFLSKPVSASGFTILFVLHIFLCCSTSNVQAESKKGGFYLVGMGPGPLDLMTVRAKKIVQEASLVICHEYYKDTCAPLLRDKEVLITPKGVWIWFGYGKEASNFHGKELEKFQASERLRAHVIAKVGKAVKQGKTVAALFGGDPLIYGSGHWYLEEFQYLNPAVVPGLSSFNAANAALKTDITYGENCKSTILTADDWPGKRDTIEELSSHQVTMVIFTMGFELERLVAKLSKHYPPKIPVAIVCFAGYKEKERVIKATLGTILDKIRNQKLPFEHLVYVGENLDLKWKKE